jgi:hypothetical protein
MEKSSAQKHMGVKEDDSSTGRVWAAGFHDITGCSHLAVILKLNEPFISLIFQFFFNPW